MTIAAVRRYCLAKPGTIFEDFPFGEETLVIKVFGKAFLLSDLTRHPPAMNLKCEPARALELRARYDAVLPGYHMNKKHWNTVVLDGSIPPQEILAMIDHSFEEVVRGLKRTERAKVLGIRSSKRQREKIR
ncbi:MAG: MmcQ/YjbR family DNA-binding protein [Ignavibacteriales bacterium]|nr:MmcQ/YjbR family DNA-binding protein [Ignavibacteriales bacterium]